MLVERIGYTEVLPVVSNPGIIDPKAFIDEVITQRLPNPFTPDTPHRIATDTSQKIPVSFGETLKSYQADSKVNLYDAGLADKVRECSKKCLQVSEQSLNAREVFGVRIVAVYKQKIHPSVHSFFIDLIDKYKISSLQVTVDGVGEVHDRKRPFADGNGSYSRIMDNIALALSHGVKISLRVNVGRSNLSSITELPEDFRQRGFSESENESENFSYYFKAVDSPDDGIKDSEVRRKL